MVAFMAQINVLGEELQPCSLDPLTGYYRTGCCENHGDDPGLHVICVVCTDAFLAYSRDVGNDLSTPMPQHGFAGLVAGDQWLHSFPTRRSSDYPTLERDRKSVV